MSNEIIKGELEAKINELHNQLEIADENLLDCENTKPPSPEDVTGTEARLRANALKKWEGEKKRLWTIKSGIEKAIAKLRYSLNTLDEVVEIIEKDNLFYVNSEHKYYHLQAERGGGWATFSAAALEKTYPHFFTVSDEERKEHGVTKADKVNSFDISMLNLGRIKDEVVFYATKPPLTFQLNLYRADSKIEPTPLADGEQPHPMFDYIMEAVTGGDAACRDWLERCILYKYLYPDTAMLSTPVFCGKGGAGKDTLYYVMQTIFSNRYVPNDMLLGRETMEKTGYLKNAFIVLFNELEPIGSNSDKYQFIKSRTMKDTVSITEKYQVQQNTSDNVTWFWIAANKTLGEKCPIPLEGDGIDGVDRRFSPIIVRKSLTDVLVERLGLTVEQAAAWKTREMTQKKTHKSEEEVGRWLWSLILKHMPESGDIWDLDLPGPHHGTDYEILTAHQGGQLGDFCWNVWGIWGPDWLTLSWAYKLYERYAECSNIQERYRLRKETFKETVNDFLSKNYQGEWEYRNWSLKTGGNTWGWKWVKGDPTVRSVANNKCFGWGLFNTSGGVKGNGGGSAGDLTAIRERLVGHSTGAAIDNFEWDLASDIIQSLKAQGIRSEFRAHPERRVGLTVLDGQPETEPTRPDETQTGGGEEVVTDERRALIRERVRLMSNQDKRDPMVKEQRLVEIQDRLRELEGFTPVVRSKGDAKELDAKKFL